MTRPLLRNAVGLFFRDGSRRKVFVIDCPREPEARISPVAKTGPEFSGYWISVKPRLDRSEVVFIEHDRGSATRGSHRSRVDKGRSK